MQLALGAVEVADAVGPAVQALLADAGGAVATLGPIDDDPGALTATLLQAAIDTMLWSPSMAPPSDGTTISRRAATATGRACRRSSPSRSANLRAACTWSGHGAGWRPPSGPARRRPGSRHGARPGRRERLDGRSPRGRAPAGRRPVEVWPMAGQVPTDSPPHDRGNRIAGTGM